MSRLFIYLVICCLHLGNVTSGLLCKDPATDVIFLIDDTGSYNTDEFRLELEFAAKMVKEFHLESKSYQAGVFTFSTDAQLQIRLGEMTDSAALATRIRQIPYSGGYTFLGKSLNTVREGFSIASGGRKNVRKVLIVITDGNTVDPEETAESVKLLKQSDIEVYAIVSGPDADSKLTRSLVSKSTDMFTITKMSDLQSVVARVKKTVCIDEHYVCGQEAMDIVFVLDESFSIALDQFIWLRYFLSWFVRSSIIGPQNAQVSVVAFADKVRNVFWLNDYPYKDDMSKRIHEIKREGGATYTNLALKHVRMESFKYEHGGRSGAQKVVLVLTDGQSMVPEDTFKEAQGLHGMGAHVFVIGVGEGVSIEELKKVASMEENVFLAKSFATLADISDDVQLKVCRKR